MCFVIRCQLRNVFCSHYTLLFPKTPRAVLPPSSPSNQQAPIEDDNVASSEEEFISEYDEHPHTPGWSKPLTSNKSEFLVKLNQLKALPGREGHMESQLLIHDYTERNRYRRNYKAYERLVDVLRQSLPTPEEQSQVLEAQELSDKQLDRNFYYSNDEPKEYVCIVCIHTLIVLIMLKCLNNCFLV